ncbi:single-strand selective monofunctional uracil DNA glycosylase [Cephus cinctus]|uniref:Single-strand selective monofunctional uracil DNA glycosylase n=1 Tax=Cephus cinctus TaxID=211228 RepID=A0AAJ7BIQ9_CEPCN|nr:single-strand selective monofunctional uracil DNA glycosylase [Cephus cinctus]
MTSSKKLKLECNEIPLDLSIKKNCNVICEGDENATIDSNNLVFEEHKDYATDDNLDDSGVFVIPAIPPLPINLAEKLLVLEQALNDKLKNIEFYHPIAYVYRPLEYAFEVHSMYVHKYCHSAKKILFLGMNPGPWGMSQTGIPFGEVNMVRDWLKLSGDIGKPFKEQPDRKVTGFACSRSEISGFRFWSLFRDLCGNPENFFQYAFLHNYCPIALMDAGGRNITPAELKGPEQISLYGYCDDALVAAIKLLKVQTIVGIGRFAEKRAQTVVKSAGLSTQIMYIPHPSPRSVGNINWNEKATKRLKELNLLQFFTQ